MVNVKKYSSHNYIQYISPELDRLMEKDNSKLPVNRTRLPQVSIPKDMTPEHYQGMNLLPGNRVGEDYRQKYLDKLSELCVNGYITQDEFDRRAEWVNSAQTSEQVEIAFLDLQNALRAMTAKEYFQKDIRANREKLHKTWLIGPAFVYLVVVLCMVIDALSGAYIGVGILAGEMMVLTTILAYRWGKHHG